MTHTADILLEQLEKLLCCRRSSDDNENDAVWYEAAIRMSTGRPELIGERDEILQAMAALRAMEEDGLISPVAMPSPAGAGHIRARARYLIAGGFAAVFLVAAGLLLLSRNFTSTGVVESSVSPLTPKGSADELHVAVRRGDASFQLKSDQTLRDGDVLGFFYSAQEAGYLRLYNVDSAAAVVRLYPLEDQASGAIVPGDSLALPDGAVVSGAHGCEWLVAIFSDSPLQSQESQIYQELKENMQRAVTCFTHFTIPGARTVRIVVVSAGVSK